MLAVASCRGPRPGKGTSKASIHYPLYKPQRYMRDTTILPYINPGIPHKFSSSTERHQSRYTPNSTMQ
jgi:hypothetical protein